MTNQFNATVIHATTVCVGSKGVLIRGPSGSGKSDLALRLLDRGAELVADDYTRVWRESFTLYATAPATISGKLEVRGIGIIDWPAVPTAALALCVNLVAPSEDGEVILGVRLPSISLPAFAYSAPIIIERTARQMA